MNKSILDFYVLRSVSGTSLYGGDLRLMQMFLRPKHLTVIRRAPVTPNCGERSGPLRLMVGR